MNSKIVGGKYNKWGIGIFLSIILVTGIYFYNKLVTDRLDKIQSLQNEIAALKEKQDAMSYLLARTDLDSQMFFEKLLGNVNKKLESMRENLDKSPLKDQDREALVSKYGSLLKEKDSMLARMEEFISKQNQAYKKLIGLSDKSDGSAPQSPQTVTLNDEFDQIVQQNTALNERLNETNEEIEKSGAEADQLDSELANLKLAQLDAVAERLASAKLSAKDQKSAAIHKPEKTPLKGKGGKEAAGEKQGPPRVKKTSADEKAARSVIQTARKETESKPIQSNTANGFQFDLLQCKKKSSAVKCVFRVVNKKEEDYLVLNNKTRSFDEFGKPYEPGLSRIVDAKIDLQRGLLIKRLKPKHPVEMTIEFKDFPRESNKLAVIDLVGSRGTDSELTTKFINIRLL